MSLAAVETADLFITLPVTALLFADGRPLLDFFGLPPFSIFFAELHVLQQSSVCVSQVTDSRVLCESLVETRWVHFTLVFLDI